MLSVARVPAAVAGHPVRCLVIDDGSTDDTAARAAATGAAVRTGLAAAVAAGAVAVAFCDPDREYDPADLERLVAPILLSGPSSVAGRGRSGSLGGGGDAHRFGAEADLAGAGRLDVTFDVEVG